MILDMMTNNYTILSFRYHSSEAKIIQHNHPVMTNKTSQIMYIKSEVYLGVFEKGI